MKARMLLTLVLIFAVGCATPYRRSGLAGGFSETQLQENVFTVYFRGNGYTSPERCSDFALLRCAELALDHGFRYFAVADSAQDAKTTFYNTGGASHTYGTINTFGNTSYGSFNTYHSGSNTIPVSKPRSSYTIFCFKERPDADAMVFDATFVAKSLREKYRLVEQPQSSEESNNKR
jgi:hypothetical protein